MFNTQLQRARKAAGLSLRALGAQVGVSHTAVKKYEDGAAMPSSGILLGLSRALHVRSEYFFRPDLVALEGIEYRKHSSLPKKRLDAITHEVIDQIGRRLELESLFPQPPGKPFAAVEALPAAIANLDGIEGAAEQVRQAWQLGYEPLPDLVAVLENHGVRVFMVDANGDAKFDGLAARVKGMPVVVVGRHWPGDRQRFTLAHELGHLMLESRVSDGLDGELACNRFAGAFLFPRAAVLRELGPHRTALELKELALLKTEFGLSMAGVLHRARDLGIISTAYWNQQAKLFRAKNWRRHEPGLACPAEKAHIFEQLVFHALAEEYIGESKAAELMGMSQVQFRLFRAMEGDGEAAPCC